MGQAISQIIKISVKTTATRSFTWRGQLAHKGKKKKKRIRHIETSCVWNCTILFLVSAGSFTVLRCVWSFSTTWNFQICYSILLKAFLKFGRSFCLGYARSQDPSIKYQWGEWISTSFIPASELVMEISRKQMLLQNVWSSLFCSITIS